MILYIFQGNETQIYYPKPGKSTLFQNLVGQCKKMEIEFIDQFESINWDKYEVIVDALFGFSFKPPARQESMPLLKKLSELERPKHSLVSIDIPSGWHVENGPCDDCSTPIIKPDCLISLTAPKQCAIHFKGRFHWLGGRFVPPSLERKYELNLPAYKGVEQTLLLKKEL